ncbi:MAG: transposase [Acidobacteriia bacterium]|nr:transposase [Terriglobia bacterium]
MGSATYLITFVCYGSHLHGEEGAVDRFHNVPRTPTLAADPARLKKAQSIMKWAPYSLDECRRHIVLRGLLRACERREWGLIAAHVRTNHVHAIVQGNRSAEQMMSALKAYASRALNEARLDTAHRRHWAYHGSTRYLWTRAQVERAVRYVVAEQGEAMAVHFPVL